jgi:hypothetical protein
MSGDHKCLTCEHWGGNVRVYGSSGFESVRQASGKCFCKGVNNPHYQNGDHLAADDGCGFWEAHYELKR